MQIKINLKILIFILLFIITDQIKIYGILMWFAFLHELGHLIIGLILGFKPKVLSIKPVGFSISFKTNVNDYLQNFRKGNKIEFKKIFIGLAGPFTNLLISLIYWYFNVDFLNIPRELAIYSNILIGIFNLIIIYPLDGGRILKSILHIFMGFEKSEKLIKIISWIILIVITISSSILILYLKNIAVLIIVLYLWLICLRYNKSTSD